MAAASHTSIIERQKVMLSAWQTFRNRYRFASIKNGSADFRRAFAGCLRDAWAKARQVLAFANVTLAELASRISTLHERIVVAGYADNFGVANRETTTASGELAALRANAARLGVRPAN